MWSRRRSSNTSLQRQFSQDLSQSAASYFQPNLPASNVINGEQGIMTSQQQQQQQQPFNASMAFQNNNNGGGGDGWDDWDWNENSSGPGGAQNQAPPQQVNSPSVNFNQSPQQQIFNNSYQQSPMQYQPTYFQSAQNNYQNQQQGPLPSQPQLQQQQFQQFSTLAPSNIPPPSDPNQNFNWSMHPNFCVSPTTSTEVQQGHSRSTSNCSSEMIRNEAVNSFEQQQVIQSPDVMQNHQNQPSRIPDVRNNTPQMAPPAVKQNPQMARLMKTDGLTSQWSVESQVSQTSSERSNESGELDSRSSATVTSDEGGFYHHQHHHLQQQQQQQPPQFIEQKADVIQEMRNVTEHQPVQPILDPNMDKLDQALFEMNVFQGGATVPNQQSFNPIPVAPVVQEQVKESSLPPPPPLVGTGNQPNFNQIVKLPSHTPSPPPAFNSTPVTTSVEPPKKSTSPQVNLPPPPMTSDKRGVNPYKRTGQAHHHTLNFQQPAVKLPAVMPTNFYQDGVGGNPLQDIPTEQASTVEHQQRPDEVPRLGKETQEMSFMPKASPTPDATISGMTHARGRGSLVNQGHPSSPRRDHVHQQSTQEIMNQNRPIEPTYGRNQVQYNVSPQQQQQQHPVEPVRPERGHNQAVGQEFYDDQRRRTDSDRSQPSPHTPMTVRQPETHPQQLVPSPVATIQNVSSIVLPEPELTHDMSVRNDRNEYLQTGHLSEDNYNPPPSIERTPLDVHVTRGTPRGMSRYVLGQPENDTSNNQEPPPGLDRMILGTDLDNSQLDLAREADGQVSDSSTVQPNRTYTNQINAPALKEIEITDRNLYTVAGESGKRSNTKRRIVPGTEINRSPTAPAVTGTTTNVNVSLSQSILGSQLSPTPSNPQQQSHVMTPPEQVIPEQERELAVDGENLQDQEIQQQQQQQQPMPKRNEMTREEPTEGADTLDEGTPPIPRDKGDTESNLTTETGRKETSTNDDSDRGVYYRSKKGTPKEDAARSKAPQRSKGKDDFYSDSDYSESERHRYREGSVREGSANKGERGTLGRRKDEKDRDRREKKHKDERYLEMKKHFAIG